MKKLSSVLLLATLSLLAEPVLVPVSAQQLAAPNETAHRYLWQQVRPTRQSSDLEARECTSA